MKKREVRLSLYQQDRDFQISIEADGCGYRIMGPKFDGTSRLIKSIILTERDMDEMRLYIAELDSPREHECDYDETGKCYICGGSMFMREESHDWYCGCDHWNESNLEFCAQCGRRPGATA